MDMTEFSGTCILSPPHKCYGRPINCLPHQIRESCSVKLGFGKKSKRAREEDGWPVGHLVYLFFNNHCKAKVNGSASL